MLFVHVYLYVMYELVLFLCYIAYSINQLETLDLLNASLFNILIFRSADFTEFYKKEGDVLVKQEDMTSLIINITPFGHSIAGV